MISIVDNDRLEFENLGLARQTSFGENRAQSLAIVRDAE
jgi:hypothetical protein